jgi:hypothetical protein
VLGWGWPTFHKKCKKEKCLLLGWANHLLYFVWTHGFYVGHEMVPNCNDTCGLGRFKLILLMGWCGLGNRDKLEVWLGVGAINFLMAWCGFRPILRPSHHSYIYFVKPQLCVNTPI